MGFSRLILLNAQGWAADSVAALEMCEAFQSSEALPGLGAEHRNSLESAVAPAFLHGDVLISVRCDMCETLVDEEKRAALNSVGKLVDAISTVWMQAAAHTALHIRRVAVRRAACTLPRGALSVPPPRLAHPA